MALFKLADYKMTERLGEFVAFTLPAGSGWFLLAKRSTDASYLNAEPFLNRNIANTWHWGSYLLVEPCMGCHQVL
jgi:hypothetical protein